MDGCSASNNAVPTAPDNAYDYGRETALRYAIDHCRNLGSGGEVMHFANYFHAYLSGK